MDLSHLILRMFAKSPHEGLSVHMNRSCECVALLPDFFTKVFSGDWSAVMAIKQKINGLESDADGLKKKVYMDLHSNLMLPVSRQDVLGLLKSQDSIANQTQDIAGIVYGRRMVVPDEMQSPFSNFVASSVETCLKARDVVGEMESAIQDSFSKRSQTVIKKKVESVMQAAKAIAWIVRVDGTRIRREAPRAMSVHLEHMKLKTNVPNVYLVNIKM